MLGKPPLTSSLLTFTQQLAPLLRFLPLMLVLPLILVSACSSVNHERLAGVEGRMFGEGGTPLSRTDTTLRVAYAGFSLIGYERDVETLYPHTTKFEAEINPLIYQSIKGIEPHHYILKTEGFNHLDQGDTVALTLAMNRETVGLRKISNHWQVVIDLSAQVLVFDFDGEERSIIASYPIAPPIYIDTFTHKPSQKEISRLVKGLFFGTLPESSGSMMTEFKKIITEAPIKQKYAQEVGIREVKVNPSALTYIPDYLKDRPKKLEYYLAQNFAKMLTANQKISVIPYTSDQSHAKLSMRFTGQNQHQMMTLPEADYTFDLNLRGFKKVPYSNNQFGKADIYGAFIEMTFSQNIETLDSSENSSDSLLQLNLKKAVTKVIPADQPIVFHWGAYQEALLTLFNDFTLQMGKKPTRQWINEQQISSLNRKKFTQVNEVLEKCR